MKSHRQRQEDHLLDKKKASSIKWELIMKRMRDGGKVDHQEIAHAMNECNWVDYALIRVGLSRFL